MFLAPAGSTRYDDGQLLLVILQPISLIHKALPRLSEFLTICSLVTYPNKQASPRMHSSKAAGMGSCLCPWQTEKGKPGRRGCPTVAWLLSQSPVLVCSPFRFANPGHPPAESTFPDQRNLPGGDKLEPSSFISRSNTRNTIPLFRIHVPCRCLLCPVGLEAPHGFPPSRCVVPGAGSMAMVAALLQQDRAGERVHGP